MVKDISATFRSAWLYVRWAVLSECAVTRVASNKILRLGQVRPPARCPAIGPTFSARWAHSCSRACARAARSRFSAAGSILSRTRKRGRGRGDRPEQCRLIAQYCEVADRPATVGEQDREIGHHPARVMAGVAFPQIGHSVAERRGQPAAISQPGQQPGPDVRHDAGAVRGHRDRRSSSCRVHERSASSVWSI